MEAETIVREMADDNGIISPEAPSTENVTEPSVDVDINIRNDEVRLFETTSGRQFFRTPEMAENMYVEPVPTPQGFRAEIVFEPAVSFTETATASPAEQPSVEGATEIKVRMD